MPETLSKLRNYGLLASVGIILCLSIFAAFQGLKLKDASERADRLSRNQSALLNDLAKETNRAGNLQATVDALTLRAGELESLIPSYEKKLKDMAVRLKDAQHLAQVQTELAAAVEAHRDTVWQYIERPDTASRGRARYAYTDAWLSAVVTIEDDAVAGLQIQARDTLTLVAHKERRKCLFKKPKIIHYSVESTSPYIEIDGVQYIEITD